MDFCGAVIAVLTGGTHLKKQTILFALIFCVALAGCNQPAPPQGGGPSEPQEIPEADVIITEPEEPAEPAAPAAGQVAMVYIGTRANGFTDYPIVYDGDLTPEKLIQGIADLTGWDLTLAEPVISGKGSMSVCLSGESALFTGPPNPQREEFHMYDVGQLAETILDSIQKTLQMGFTGEGGDPDALDIWYYMEDQPLELPILGLSWPIDQPYQWTSAGSS